MCVFNGTCTEKRSFRRNVRRPKKTELRPIDGASERVSECASESENERALGGPKEGEREGSKYVKRRGSGEA